MRLHIGGALALTQVGASAAVSWAASAQQEAGDQGDEEADEAVEPHAQPFEGRRLHGDERVDEIVEDGGDCAKGSRAEEDFCFHYCFTSPNTSSILGHLKRPVL